MKTIYQITANAISLTAEQRVLSASDYTAFIAADAAIAAAQLRAEALLRDAQEQFVEQKERGYREGLSNANATMAEKLTATTLATECYLGSIEQQLIDLVMTTVSRVIGEFDDDELATRMIRQGLKTMRAAQRIKIRAAPEQVAHIQNQVAEQFPDASIVEVIGDHDLDSGQCILESEVGSVNASVDAQLETLKRLLSEQFTDSSLALNVQPSA